MNKSKFLKLSLSTILAASLTACGGSSGSSLVVKENTGTGVTEGLGSNGDSIEIVKDTVAPTITLKGNKVVTIQKGESFSDDGATASDDTDKVINILSSGSVDKDVMGTYTITYTATDSAGNKSEIARTVNVVPRSDSGVPTILLDGKNPLTVPQGSMYIDPGATAADPQEGNLTNSINAVSDVNTMQVGEYVVTYSVEDSANNKTVVKRVVKVTDQTPPTIELNGDETITIKMDPKEERKYQEYGVTITDNVDDDIKPTIDYGEFNASKIIPGTYTITYTATDSAKNHADTNRTVQVIDNGKPIITLNGTNPMTLAHGGVYNEPNATAKDYLTSDDLNVNIEGDVNTSKVGSYTITYSATDENNNTNHIERKVNITDQTRPVIHLNGSSTVTIYLNNKYTDLRAYAEDEVDGHIEVDVDTSDINTSKTGNYVVKYTATDDANNTATAERKVIVKSRPE